MYSEKHRKTPNGHSNFYLRNSPTLYRTNYGRSNPKLINKINVDSFNILFDTRFGLALITIAISIVLVKFLHLITDKPLGMILNETGNELWIRFKIISIWLNENYDHTYWPILSGVAVTLFTWAMVYWDSDIPGINPPTPFSARRFSRFKSDRMFHLNYSMGVLSGLAVFYLLLISNEK